MAGQQASSSPDRKAANQQRSSSSSNNNNNNNNSNNNNDNNKPSNRSAGNSRAALLLLLTSGFFIVGLLFDYMPIIVDSQIKRTIELATNEEIQSIWSRPPIDLHSYYWLFDIQNPEHFMAGERARMRKVGPFHFTSRLEKRIVDISRNKYRIIYNSTRHIKFNESEQTTSLDEPLHLLNPLFVGMLESIRQFAGAMDEQTKQMSLISVQRLAAKYNESLVMKLTARQALLGRRVEMLSAARKMITTLGLDVQIPAALSGNLFGYVAVQNNTWSGPMEVYTGYQASMNSLGEIISVMGQRRLTRFRGRCNRLQASAGELRPMPLVEGQILEIFRPEFCRIVRLKPTGVRQLREGRALGFALAPEDFASASSNPDNRCFCISKKPLTAEPAQANSSSSSPLQAATPLEEDSFCSLDGVIEMAPCAMWTPLVLSVSGIPIDPKMTSSLQDWDPELLHSEVELLPNADPQAQLLILKRLGVPIRVDLTVTIFMKVLRDSRIKEMKSVPEVSYIPLLMLREIVSLPANLGAIIVNLESFLALTQHVKLIMYLSAVVLLCWLTGHYYNRAAARESHSSVKPAAGSSLDGRAKSTARTSGARKLAGLSVASGELANSSSTINTEITRVAGSNFGELLADDEVVEIRGGADDASRSSTKRRTKRGIQVSSSGGPQQQQQPALIFSKVDELRALAAGSAAVAPAPESGPPARSQTDEAVTSERRREVGTTRSREDSSALCDSGLASSAVSAEEALNSSEPSGLSGASNGEAPLAEDDEGEASSTRNQTGPKLERSLRRRNWFVQVYSNFVRILTDIRTSISDASQLDVSSNDYQDKQLELLAGRIDNWQRLSSSAEPTPPRVTPDIPSGAPAEGANEWAGPHASEPELREEALMEGAQELRRDVEEATRTGQLGDAKEDNLTTSDGSEERSLQTSRSTQPDEALSESATGGSPESESVQSGQTVIQQQGQEDEGSAKALALERLERALGAASPEPQGAAGQRAGLPKLMINSASGTESPPELALHIAAAGKAQSTLPASLSFSSSGSSSIDVEPASSPATPAARGSAPNRKPISERRSDESQRSVAAFSRRTNPQAPIKLVSNEAPTSARVLSTS